MRILSFSLGLLTALLLVPGARSQPGEGAGQGQGRGSLDANDDVRPAHQAAKPTIVWVSLPGGEFKMGSEDGTKDEYPIHVVNLSGFDISQNEVTVSQYQACVSAGVCAPPHWDDSSCRVHDGRRWGAGNLRPEFRGPNQPIVCVDWHQASAFAAWVDARLPTEAEWEYAATGGLENHPYPWGTDQPTCTKAVFDDATGNGNGCGTEATWPVCSKPDGNSPHGLCDMAGNAWEWVSDWSEYYYYKDSPTDNPTGPETGKDKVNRGGSFTSTPFGLRTALRSPDSPGTAASNIGFRVVRSKVK